VRKQQKVRRPSNFRATATLRLQRSWTHWRLSRQLRRTAKEYRRLQLILMQLDSQHSLLRQLETELTALRRREAELLESRQFRLTKQLPPAVNQVEELNRLLGLEPSNPQR
jgi:hypothetical protein